MHVILTLILFLLILGILIFVHELGHFMVAKWMGMRVDEFALGFPPRIWARKKGETTYALNIIPLGGYVKIHGESPDHEEDGEPNSFEKKSVWARIAVILAGVTMNVLFAFVILVIAFSVGFVSISQNLQAVPGAVVKHNEVYVADIQKDSPADKAGLKAGDKIKSFIDVTDNSVKTVSTVQELVDYTKAEQTAGHNLITVVFDRDGTAMSAPVTLAAEGPPLGVYIEPYSTVRVPVWQAPKVAVKEIGAIFAITWDALASFGRQLFGHAKLDPNVSGPVGIYQATGSAAQAGVVSVVFLVVALSLNLALLNVLPLPALDGGKFLFLLIEAIAGKRVVGKKFESIITFISFVFLIGLILILSVRDVIRLF
jgi:regulator of sigma E protease